jgi:hypothetical protein
VHAEQVHRLWIAGGRSGFRQLIGPWEVTAIEGAAWIAGLAAGRKRGRYQEQKEEFFVGGASQGGPRAGERNV